MQSPRIVVVGSSNTDMVVRSARIPLPGETVTGGEFFCVAGGKGANQAVAAARLGGKVALVAKVGDDLLGAQAIEGYQREGIDVSHLLRTSDAPTGVALILVDHSGENSISVASGANHALTVSDVRNAAEAIRDANVLMLQMETPLETVLAAAEMAHDAGVPVILDPAPTPDEPLDAGLLSPVSCLTPNETEASRLTGVDVRDEPSARDAAARLLDRGPRCVILTLGAAGALVCDHSSTIKIDGFPVEAVDSTAAGDAFNGGLAFALGTGKPLPQAVVEACACGALATTKPGAQPSLPCGEQLAAFLDRHR